MAYSAMQYSYAKWMAAALAVVTAIVLLAPTASAGDWWRNDIVKQTAIGAGVGVAAGALSDESSALKGAGVGALAGAATGLIDYSGKLDRHPLVRNAAKGAIIGTGTSAVMNSGKVKGALVGAGAGAGYHLIRDYLDSRY